MSSDGLRNERAKVVWHPLESLDGFVSGWFRFWVAQRCYPKGTRLSTKRAIGPAPGPALPGSRPSGGALAGPPGLRLLDEVGNDLRDLLRDQPVLAVADGVVAIEKGHGAELEKRGALLADVGNLPLYPCRGRERSELGVAVDDDRDRVGLGG